VYRKVAVCQIAPFLYDSLKVLSDRVDRNSSNGVANSYGLDCSGIESQFWRGFPHPFSKTKGPMEPPLQGVPGPFPGGKAGGAWRKPATLSSCEVKERLELYFYSQSGPAWLDLGRIYFYIYLQIRRINN
jgi:hypothetical protein